MKISITKFWGNNVNDIGNFTMAGHNNIDDTMFGATDKLKNGDKIQMTHADIRFTPSTMVLSSNQQSVINTQLSGPLFIYTNDTQLLRYP